MQYKRNEFMRLLEALEDQGGTHLDELCEDRYFTEFAGPRVKGFELPMCGEMSVMEVPYDRRGDGDAIERGTVKVCAVDDAVGLWPRFKDQVYA